MRFGFKEIKPDFDKLTMPRPSAGGEPLHPFLGSRHVGPQIKLVAYVAKHSDEKPGPPL